MCRLHAGNVSENALYVSRTYQRSQNEEKRIRNPQIPRTPLDAQISIYFREGFTLILNECYANDPKFKIMRFLHEFSVIELSFLGVHTSVCMNTMIT